jgi:hypothetical protein
MCDCLQISFNLDGDITTQTLQASGTYNGANLYTFTYNSTDWTLWYDSAGMKWVIAANPDFTDPAFFLAILAYSGDCPDSILAGFEWVMLVGGLTIQTMGVECPAECGREDRQMWQFKSVKIPQDFVEPDRGYEDCCCEQLVLASTGNSWETDKASGWIKLGDSLDTCTFQLFKGSALASYQPAPVQFPSDALAFYATIDWIDVLLSDGAGCYTFKASYNISGIQGSITIGNYRLKPYSIANALGTARVRCVFNGVQEADGINFTGSNVVSDIRFSGYIGNRQPNMQIDNIIYGNRELKRVIRENLYSYEIITDPLQECIIKPLTEVYLLSENELYISDYNAFNHTYSYQDTPAIVQESPEIEYYDFSRKAKLTCKVGDKFNNKRTYY